MSKAGADNAPEALQRFSRQVVFAPLGAQGQENLSAGRVLAVGAGGLGSWSTQLLVRAGLGFLRLVDDDRVDLTNLHRQSLYNDADARAKLPKVQCAKRRLEKLNPGVTIQAVPSRLVAANAEELCAGVDLILDATDNFASRMLINDLSVKLGIPWVMAGVVGAEGQCATFLPEPGPCLRCIMDAPPPACEDPNCRSAGVLGPAVAAVASMQAMEALKLVSGCEQDVCRDLVKMDFWHNRFQRIDLSEARDPDCPCCAHRQWEYLEP